MFSRKPKIKQISVTSVGEFIFTFGLGADGKVYLWQSATAVWKLHQQEATDEPV